MSNKALAMVLFELLGHRTNAHYIYNNETGIPIIAKGDTKLGEYRDLPLTEDVIEQHLDGKITIGIFPHNLDDECIFFAIDVDYHKNKGDPIIKKKTNFKTAKRIRQHLWDKYKRIGIIERSGSEASYHVWVLIKPSPGPDVFRFGRHIIKELGLTLDKNTEHPENEVELFPKQAKASTTPKQYGTQIKCPCGIHRLNGNRSYFLIPKDLNNPTTNVKKITNTEKLSHLLYAIPRETIPIVPVEHDSIIETQVSKKPEIPFHSFESLLTNQPMCIRVPFLYEGIKTTKALKFRAAYNSCSKGGTDEQVQRWFINQPGYNEKTTKLKIAMVRNIIIDEILKEERIDPKGELTPNQLKEEKKERRKEIDNDVRNGKYAYKAVWDCKILSKECGKKMKKELCQGICQARKNYRASTNVFESIKAERGTKLPIIRIIWEDINIKENEYKSKYIQVSTKRLKQVLNKHQTLGIEEVEDLIKYYFVPLGFMEKRKSQLTFTIKKEEMYRFRKEDISNVLKTE